MPGQSSAGDVLPLSCVCSVWLSVDESLGLALQLDSCKAPNAERVDQCIMLALCLKPRVTRDSSSGYGARSMSRSITTCLALSSPKSEQALLYVLSSPEGAWTDFHVDFGGSLVWYHVLQGAKTFLAIPPSTAALTAYEKWASSPKQVHCRCRAAQHLCVNICNLVFMHGC